MDEKQFWLELCDWVEKPEESWHKEANQVNTLDEMLTPEEWCRKLSKLGASVSPRALRSKAREHGQFYSLGRAMLLSAGHVETIMKLDAAGTQQTRQRG
ncbi:hypothetical protein [Roseobacter sp. A03A-229]